MTKACFSNLRQLCNSEHDQIVKLAPSLCHKALFPNSTERQNVKLALFDEKTAVALVHFGKNAKLTSVVLMNLFL